MRCLAIGSLVLVTALAATVRGDEPENTPLPAQQQTQQQDQPAAAEPDRQVRLQLTIVEVSLDGMQRRKLDFAQFGLRQQKPSATATPARAFIGPQQIDREDAKKLLDSLTAQGVLKILGAPTMVVSPRQPGYFFTPGKTSKKVRPESEQSLAERKVGTEVHVTADWLSGSRVKLDLRAKQTDIEPLLSVATRGGIAPGYRTREMDLPIEVDLGTTAVFGGLGQQETVRDPRTRRNVQRETETLFLIAPDEFHAEAEGLASPPKNKPDAPTTK